MSNADRDTHFTGFANALFNDLDWNSVFVSGELPGWEHQCKTTIARRTYDLVERIMDTAYVHDICTTMDEIPDMPVLLDEKRV